MCMKHINHYRQTCHKAMQNKIAMPFKTLDRLHSAKNSKQFWNIVRKSKQNDVQDDAISNSTLTEYFQEKMSSSINPTDVITEAEVTVRQKYNHQCQVVLILQM